MTTRVIRVKIRPHPGSERNANDRPRDDKTARGQRISKGAIKRFSPVFSESYDRQDDYGSRSCERPEAGNGTDDLKTGGAEMSFGPPGFGGVFDEQNLLSGCVPS